MDQPTQTISLAHTHTHANNTHTHTNHPQYQSECELMRQHMSASPQLQHKQKDTNATLSTSIATRPTCAQFIYRHASGRAKMKTNMMCVFPFARCMNKYAGRVNVKGFSPGAGPRLISVADGWNGAQERLADRLPCPVVVPCSHHCLRYRPLVSSAVEAQATHSEEPAAS
jgi:hypothetical protein